MYRFKNFLAVFFKNLMKQMPPLHQCEEVKYGLSNGIYKMRPQKNQRSRSKRVKSLKSNISKTVVRESVIKSRSRSF